MRELRGTDQSFNLNIINIFHYEKFGLIFEDNYNLMIVNATTQDVLNILLIKILKSPLWPNPLNQLSYILTFGQASSKCDGSLSTLVLPSSVRQYLSSLPYNQHLSIK